MKSINISVIVPVLNEEDNIIFFLNSLINQTLKPNEIIICDGGSTDKTLSLIRDFQINNKEIILTKEKSICRGSGRNIAIKQSKSNYIALIDAGTYADKFWLERMANIIVSKDSIDIIFGVVKPIINNNFDLSLSTVILGKYYDNYLLIPTVASILLKKESLEIIGYFPTNAKGKYVVEDLIFLNNIKKSKLNFLNCKNAIVYWHLSKNYSQLMKRYINNSRGGIACGFFKNWHLKMLQNLFIYIFLIFIAMFNYKFILFFFMFHFFRVYSYFKYINKEYKLSFYSRIINFFYISNFIFTIDTATLIGMFKWLFIDKGEIIKND